MIETAPIVRLNYAPKSGSSWQCLPATSLKYSLHRRSLLDRRRIRGGGVWLLRRIVIYAVSDPYRPIGPPVIPATPGAIALFVILTGCGSITAAAANVTSLRTTEFAAWIVWHTKVNHKDEKFRATADDMVNQIRDAIDWSTENLAAVEGLIVATAWSSPIWRPIPPAIPRLSPRDDTCLA